MAAIGAALSVCSGVSTASYAGARPTGHRTNSGRKPDDRCA
jgi:hypothetical protein